MPYTIAHDGLVREFTLAAPLVEEGVELAGAPGHTFELAASPTANGEASATDLFEVEMRYDLVAQPSSGTTIGWAWPPFRFGT